MPRKAGATKRPVKVMETLSNAASLFQVSSMPMLATNIGVPVNSDILMKNRQESAPERVRGLSRPSTIMCPW
ncbi:MAG TPA: hypothetical protein VG672_06745 [Bryobacteraceae bacterium]|nr:hypothetical protein [Bryobacteraceae bacterium]